MDIVEAQLTDLDPFFEYLNKQLDENADDNTPLFQPVAKQHSRVTEELKTRFRNGFSTPFGTCGWRKLWLVKDPNNGTIHGHIDLRHHNDSYTFHRVLLGMGVNSSTRKQGVGMRLLKHVMQFCTENDNIDWLDLQVISSNTPAKNLYLKNGFKIVGEIHDFYRIDGDLFSEVTMSFQTK